MVSGTSLHLFSSQEVTVITVVQISVSVDIGSETDGLALVVGSTLEDGNGQ